MTGTNQISIFSLLLAAIPIFLVFLILFRIKANIKYHIYTFLRMILQLITIGYILNFIFSTDKSWVVLIILFVMLFISSIISMRTTTKKHPHMLLIAICAILVGGGGSLTFLTQVILRIEPWYRAESIIPLAGMMFFNSLNVITLSIDRYEREIEHNKSINEAQQTAIKVSIIPITNSFLAAGIVSLPGLMTGQILSGISPLVAVRYQIVILCMIFSAQVFSVFLYLKFLQFFETYMQKKKNNI